MSFLRALPFVVLFVVGGCHADTAECEAPKYPEACCCQGDQVDAPSCGPEGLTCREGYRLYRGDDCQCLAGRNSPCCTPSPVDSGRD